MEVGLHSISGVRAVLAKLDGVDIFKEASHEAFYKRELPLLAECFLDHKSS